MDNIKILKHLVYEVIFRDFHKVVCPCIFLKEDKPKLRKRAYVVLDGLISNIAKLIVLYIIFQWIVS